jgi:hypothetical protein
MNKSLQFVEILIKGRNEFQIPNQYSQCVSCISLILGIIISILAAKKSPQGLVAEKKTLAPRRHTPCHRREPPGKARAVPPAADLLFPAHEPARWGSSRPGGGEVRQCCFGRCTSGSALSGLPVAVATHRRASLDAPSRSSCRLARAGRPHMVPRGGSPTAWLLLVVWCVGRSTVAAAGG